MTGRVFIDTNIFVYVADASDPAKQAQAREVLRSTSGIVVSTQVMNEFYVVATQKLKPPLPKDVAAQIVEKMDRYLCVGVDASLVHQAIRAGQRWQLSHWDALMVEAARRAKCDLVLTEDLAHGSTFDGVRIENPFLRAQAAPA